MTGGGLNEKYNVIAKVHKKPNVIKDPQMERFRMVETTNNKNMKKNWEENECLSNDYPSYWKIFLTLFNGSQSTLDGNLSKTVLARRPT